MRKVQASRPIEVASGAKEAASRANDAASMANEAASMANESASGANSAGLIYIQYKELLFITKFFNRITLK